MKSIKRLFNILRESSKNIDFTIIITYIILSLTGLVMIYSASMVMAMQGDYSDPKFYYFSQLKYTVIGFLLVFVMAYLMPAKLLKDKRLQLFMIIGIFLALLLTHIFGVEVNGKSRWLEVPFLGRFSTL
jgi:Bacterial cell division membrane protein